MKRRDDAPKVPIWVVSFADMTTLLLTFFVMLQSMARMRDPELFHEGQGAFIRAIRTCGLPEWMLGMTDSTRRDYPKVKSPMEEAGHRIPRERVVDAEDQRIRAAFRDLRQVVQVGASDSPAVRRQVVAAPIRFPAGSADLDSPGRDWLGRLAGDVKDSRSPGGTRIHVLGSAADARDRRDQWLLSAARARAAGDCLRAALPRPEAWDIVPWGAGAGSELWRTLGGAEGCFILIAIEDRENRHGG